MICGDIFVTFQINIIKVTEFFRDEEVFQGISNTWDLINNNHE